MFKVIKFVPIEKVFICVVVYFIMGLVTYILMPILMNIYLDRKEQKKYEEQDIKTENREKFLKEQYLRRKYRYIKIDDVENILNSNIDMNAKLSLLETIHGYTKEEAYKLLKMADKKGYK